MSRKKHRIVPKLGAGDQAGARKALSELLPGLKNHYGQAHPNVIRIQEILDGLNRND